MPPAHSDKNETAEISVPRLEELTPAERGAVTDADLARVRIGNVAEVWRLNVRRGTSVVAMTLFTIPVGDNAANAVTGRAFSILSAVDLAPEQGWREIRDGQYQGPIKTLGDDRS